MSEKHVSGATVAIVLEKMAFDVYVYIYVCVCGFNLERQNCLSARAAAFYFLYFYNDGSLV